MPQVIGSRIYHQEVLTDLLTPVSAFLLVARNAERAFLLESVEGGEKLGRYSFIGVGPEESFEGSFQEFRQGFPQTQAPHPPLPPFAGGAVGIFSYDMVRELEKLPDLHSPESAPAVGDRTVMMDYYSTVLAFDHLKHLVVIMSHEGPDRVEELASLLQSSSLPQAGGRGIGKGRASLEIASNFSKTDFCAAVERAKEYIRAGDIFQVVLSQRLQTPFSGDPFNVYRALRFINPSPYMFYLKRGDTCVVGASPEMLVRVQGRDLEYRPIAGTRRRGRDATEERQLEEELIRDEKERAEHLMLVDLGRNDLGRVSEYGSVSVERLMFLEKYSHVMHLVSSLKGRLRPELDRFDALAACFPAGTVTGAPKVRAMEIIEELEPCRRGIYAGAIGYIDYSGNLDTCIAIRTIVIHQGRAYVQAGAGIVADSIPERENLECHNKARALVRALEMAEQW